jgi:molecular chaperone GrpE
MKKHENTEASEENLRDDVDFEAEDELGAVGAAHAKMQKLRDELEKVKSERQEYLDGWQRSKAEAVNMRKDALRDAQRASVREQESLILDLLMPLDSFDMATSTTTWDAMEPEWTQGMELVRNQILDVLRKHGVERFGKVGEQYDPHVHDAVQEVEDVPGEPGSIAKILRYGYKMGERIVRPAQVVIKKHSQE